MENTEWKWKTRVVSSYYRMVRNNFSEVTCLKIKGKSLERKKVLILIGWVLYSGFVLWLLNMLDMQSFNISSLLNFIILLLGGSVAIHYMTEMYRTPMNAENHEEWDKFIRYLLYSAFTILLTVGVAYFEKFIYPIGGLLTLMSIFLTIFIVSKFAEQAHLEFSEIKK